MIKRLCTLLLALMMILIMSMTVFGDKSSYPIPASLPICINCNCCPAPPPILCEDDQGEDEDN